MEPKEESSGVNLLSLLDSGKFSDLQLSCEGGDFAVHKAILCAQSRVISAECEGNLEESNTNVIKIKEFDAGTVQRMLEFLYSGDYSVSPRSRSKLEDSEDSSLEYEHDSETLRIENPFCSVADATKQERLCWHLSANAIGDYYDIQPLCSLARSNVMTELEEDWSAHNFLHLLTEACTTRKTGDIKFHWLLGHIGADHLDDLARLGELKDLDMPAALSMSFVVSCMERVESLQKDIREQAMTIDSLEAKLKELIRWKDL